MIRAKSRRFVSVAVVIVGVTLLSGCDLYSYLPGTPRPSWCDPTDTAVNDGHTAAFFSAYTVAKGPLSQSDCLQVANYIQQAADFAAQYPTVAAVQAAGWHLATVFTPGQGAHFVDPNRLTGPFDPKRPNFLMYNGTASTANLVGMMFLVDSGASPPAGFPGANDHWHNHGPLCVRNSDGVVIGEVPPMTTTQCTSLGGTVQDLSSQWMVHVWLPVYAGWQATDIFNVSHPSL
ncbi:MAG TPA: hypothetical protein VHI95_13685 [Acidimicrobiales bacterium]|nr:hypothetical protein [Acidimicrobiales bacterium]